MTNQKLNCWEISQHCNSIYSSQWLCYLASIVTRLPMRAKPLCFPPPHLYSPHLSKSNLISLFAVAGLHPGSADIKISPSLSTEKDLETQYRTLEARLDSHLRMTPQSMSAIEEGKRAQLLPRPMVRYHLHYSIPPRQRQ